MTKNHLTEFWRAGFAHRPRLPRTKRNSACSNAGWLAASLKNNQENTMNDGPVVLGLNRTQDASACLMFGSQLAWAIQKERLTRRKHHWGKPGDVSGLYCPRLPGLDRPIDVLVECFSSDPEVGRLDQYNAELEQALRFAPDCRRVRISHHLAHLYSVFHPSPFHEAAVMVIDGQGSPVAELTEHWRGATEVPGDWREVSSFYRATRERTECIGKQVWERDDGRLVGLGMFYFLLTQTLFPGEGNEGKVMGLAPHGSADALGLPALEVHRNQVAVPAAWRALLHERERFRYGAPGVRFSDCANLAAAGQRAFEDALLELARWLHAATGLDQLCFAGGTGLNCSANERLLRETPFRQVFIPPAPSDAGTALGCAIYGLTEVAGLPCDYRWTHDYLGPEPAISDIEAAVAVADDLVVERVRGRGALCERMLDLLCQNKVLGLYQGRSEFGPRALGHRSILGNPRHGYVRDWINGHVKQREWFRPLAPVVLEERAAEFFDVAGPSPFMQFAAPVRPAMAAVVPAITHVDGTARLQTVGPNDDPMLRALLTGFDARTGVPVLLNTSFNGKDEPIVETPAEALASFRRMPLHALAMPPFLLRKRIEPELPE
jgi:carbamoyltransferase